MTEQALRVLYIDDDLALQRLVQRALGRRGYDVVAAGSPEEGFARLDAEAIDVIVLDHYLSTGTGLDVLASLSARQSAPPVVYVTGSAETAIAVAALKAGAADYVLKTVAEEFMELVGSAIDQAMEKARLLAEKARAEREMREARERAELLLGEVNHRVANSLSLVSTLVRMQAAALSDGPAKEALEETQGRINAIAGIHRRLYTSDDVRVVSIDEYVQSLIGELDTAMKAAGHHYSAIYVSVDPIAIPTDRAVSIGVIVTELVTNAFKYAYRDIEPGEVRVNLVRDGDRAVLSVEDDGIGFAGEGKPRGTGLGSRIVKAMAINLGTNVEYGGRDRGTRVVLRFSI